jgi:PAS domain S-box-containing protein
MHALEPEHIQIRAGELLEQGLDSENRQMDRSLAILTLFEWAALMGVAAWVSPRAWEGRGSSVHPHLWYASVLGGLIATLPVFLAFTKPGRPLTRHSIAAAQMLMAGLMVHLTGGRLESHFSYFGLLAFLAFYRDWKVLVTATAVAGADHFLRAALWPESLYGLARVTEWRALEHIAWVLFEAVILIDFMERSLLSLYGNATREARLEDMGNRIASEVKARTEELADSESRYRILFESSPLPMWLCDAGTLRFMAVNQQALKKYGYSEGEFLVMRVPDIDVEHHEEGFWNNVLGGAAPMTRRRHKRKDGSIMDVEVTSHPVEWSGRHALLILSNDTSDRVRAEQEKDSMEVQLRHAQKLESIGQLAAGIAHEINTPTQYIGDNLHFLADVFADVRVLLEAQERILPAMEGHEELRAAAGEIRQARAEADVSYLMSEMPRALEQAMDGVSRVSTLVKAMKEFSHPGTKEKTPTDLNGAILSTITVARNEWKYVARMETDLDPDLPLVACLVSDFNQVMLNLIVNAAHAIADSSTGGKLGTITVSTRVSGDQVEVRVKDTGTGIPFQVRDRIFDPFFTTKEVGKGTGQGLAIARSVVVDKHCGVLNFETEMGAGTTFIVRLPIEPAAEPIKDGATREDLMEANVI